MFKADRNEHIPFFIPVRGKTTFTLSTLAWTPDVKPADAAIVIKLERSLKRTTSLTMKYQLNDDPLDLFVHPLSPSPVFYESNTESKSTATNDALGELRLAMIKPYGVEIPGAFEFNNAVQGLVYSASVSKAVSFTF